MATRRDVGGGSNELRSSDLCAADFPACQEGAGDPGFPGPCRVCRSNWSVYEKPLNDSSSAVMILNRGDKPLSDVSISLRDLGDSTLATYTARDLWNKSELGIFTNSLTLAVPAHGVRLLRMRPHLPAPPPPPAASPNTTCPLPYFPHQAGLWSNPWPCGLDSTSCNEDNTNITMDLCAKKCGLTNGCLAFEVYMAGSVKACYLFLNELQAPFLPDSSCHTCTAKQVHPSPAPAPAPAPPTPPPPPPPHQRGKTTGHVFPRLGNCWGADPYITTKQWNYLGFPNMTNASWGRYLLQSIDSSYVFLHLPLYCASSDLFHFSSGTMYSI
eukprot:COSAG03_NODE_2460_length_2733_cov_29.331055_3_plen_327_part_00